MKNKDAATMFAFIGGAIGMHKFYLGEAGTGFIYLLFCWTGVPIVLACLDFLSLLTMSELVFNAKYNYGLLQDSPVRALPERATGYTTESLRDKVGALKEFKQLYEDNIVTAEEYEEKRRKILDSI